MRIFNLYNPSSATKPLTLYLNWTLNRVFFMYIYPNRVLIRRECNFVHSHNHHGFIPVWNCVFSLLTRSWGWISFTCIEFRSCSLVESSFNMSSWCKQVKLELLLILVFEIVVIRFREGQTAWNFEIFCVVCPYPCLNVLPTEMNASILYFQWRITIFLEVLLLFLHGYS